jgi:hypothetical protein
MSLAVQSFISSVVSKARHHDEDEEAYGCGCNSRSSKPAGGISDVAGVFDSHTLPPIFDDLQIANSRAGNQFPAPGAARLRKSSERPRGIFLLVSFFASNQSRHLPFQS